MPQDDESVALSSVATLSDGTKMSAAQYFNGVANSLAIAQEAGVGKAGDEATGAEAQNIEGQDA